MPYALKIILGAWHELSHWIIKIVFKNKDLEKSAELPNKTQL